VISESAAKKLSSEHMHKHNLPLEEGTITDPRKVHRRAQRAFQEGSAHRRLGDDGVVRVGQRVQPGDPLVIAMKPYTLKDRTGVRSNPAQSFRRPHRQDHALGFGA
jgi:DNA-directed RNA polymerase beta subunit